jgi:ATP-dependent Clp protease ATP-binding subunit ClpC
MGYELKIEQDALDFLAKQGYHEEYGARPLTRTIQHYVEDLVADEILAEHIKEGDTINIVFDKDNDTLIIKQPKKPVKK